MSQDLIRTEQPISNELRDDISGSSSGKGLETEAIIVISVVGSLLLLLLILLTAWCIWRRKGRPPSQLEVKPGTESFKLQTLGKHYPDLQGHPDRKCSLLLDRKCSQATSNEIESLIQNPPQENSEFSTKIQSDSEVAFIDGSGDLAIPQRPRNDSVYLDFKPEVGSESPSTSEKRRKSSTTSKILTMQELEKELLAEGMIEQPVVKPLKGVLAPLAKEESFNSFQSLAASNGHLSQEPKQSLLSPTKRENSSKNADNERPRSEHISEGARFKPLLPKKKRVFHHKSAVALEPTPSLAPISSPTPSKSEACLNVDEDYDDLPASSAHPVLPPKKRPNLPPKQAINKSREQLTQINTQLKSSMTDLTKADEMDYDLLPDEVDEGRKRPGSHGEEEEGEGKASQSADKNEFEDYDMPIPHSRA